MKPTWKEYTKAEWDKLCGVSPDLHPKAADGFVFNSNGVCINPHVLGIYGRGWRIGIFTAQTPSGLWSSCRDISLPTAGWSGLPWRLDLNARRTEDQARCVELELAANFVIMESDPVRVSCPICKRDAGILLRLIREKIAELSAPKQPTFTQLSLFD